MANQSPHQSGAPIGRWRGWIRGRMFRRRLRCSFCRRTEDEVTRLVAGASAYICDQCIEKCVGVLEASGWTRPAQP